MSQATIPGYAKGSPALPPSLVSDEDLDRLLQTVLWSDSDAAALRRAGELLEPQIDAILDTWYGFVGSHDFLVEHFAGPDGAPDGTYLERVRARFGQWIRDLCSAEFDRAWLDWQHEIALRHHRTKKNQTDGVRSTSEEVPLRYIIAFVVPLTLTIRQFLERAAGPEDDVDAMYDAWFKSVTLTAALWAEPYSSSW
ncbi:MAG: hypothetical protein KatS3mg008_1349 [Acidimicrobiales bacterium]|nr:MAG: hypothetical protein KatS3mg008_1349 [Acidimicrobiales bacterium]